LVLLLVLWAAVVAGVWLVLAALPAALPLLLPLLVSAGAALEPVVEALAAVVVTAAPEAVEQATAVGRSVTPKPLQSCRVKGKYQHPPLSPSARRICRQ